ncbi:MAG: RluA family pseudouridine synthase [Bacteroidota bacterium]
MSEERQTHEAEENLIEEKMPFQEASEGDLFAHYELVATGGQRLLRVDKFLSNLLPFVTRSRLKKASDAGAISVNGKAVKISYKVKPHDKVQLMLPYPPPPEIEAEEIPLDIRYEDEDVIVINKAANVVCHPAIGHRHHTLIQGIMWHQGVRGSIRDLAVDSVVRPGLVHRLDKDTTGILVVAKNEFALSNLSQQFFNRTTSRTYYAVVWGDVTEDKGTIVGHIGRSTRDRKLFRVYEDGTYGKHAVTHYEVLERFGVATLVQLKLETGRTHQIRVHMKYLGHTLFGDVFYGGDKVLAGPPTRKYKQFAQNCLKLMPRQALHAKSLAFDHPTKNERLTFESDLPEDMEALIAKLRHWAEYVG